jgi:hypothetical protein
MASESDKMKAIGKLCEGKPHAQFDEGALETEHGEVRRHPTIERVGNRSHTPKPPRLRPTLRNIFVGTEKAADRVMQSVTKFIEKRLRLVVNQQKSKVAPSRYVRFLGMTIIAGTIAISALSLQRARDKIKMLTPRGTSQTLEDTYPLTEARLK